MKAVACSVLGGLLSNDPGLQIKPCGKIPDPDLGNSGLGVGHDCEERRRLSETFEPIQIQQPHDRDLGSLHHHHRQQHF